MDTIIIWGGIDYSKLNLKHKMRMSMLYHSLKIKPSDKLKEKEN